MSIVRTNAVGLWAWARNAFKTSLEEKPRDIHKIYAWKDPDPTSACIGLKHRFDSLIPHIQEETDRTPADSRAPPTFHL